MLFAVRRTPMGSLCTGTLWLAMACAHAQASAQPGSDPLPTALEYVSPLREYRAYAEQPVMSWRETNDTVGRIGGWRTYAKEVLDNATGAQPRAGSSQPHSGPHDEGHR